jgi:hypothetical protein
VAELEELELDCTLVEPDDVPEFELVVLLLDVVVDAPPVAITVPSAPAPTMPSAARRAVSLRAPRRPDSRMFMMSPVCVPQAGGARLANPLSCL